MDKHELAKRVKNINEKAVASMEARELGAGRKKMGGNFLDDIGSIAQVALPLLALGKKKKGRGLSAGNIGLSQSPESIKYFSQMKPMKDYITPMDGWGRSGGAQCKASGVKVYKAKGRSGSGLSAGRKKMGGNFLDDFWTGFKMPFEAVGSVAKAVAPALPFLGLGKKGKMAKGKSAGGRSGSGLSAGKKVDGRKRRAELVKKVMMKMKCSLPEASKYIKQHNLY